MRGIDTSAAVLAAEPDDANQPNASRLITALRQIGYSLEQALADIIDNSINAAASNVLVRFLHDGSNLVAVAVADDGHGMSEVELYDAMRFGSVEKDSPDTLGKFGMGLKLASLSHAQSLTMFSRSNCAAAARRWTTEGIQSGWLCERLKRQAAAQILDRPWGPLDLSHSGTIVLWENIDRLPNHRSGLRYTLSTLERRLKLHLGLCFHQFLESGSVSIMLDQLLVDRPSQGVQASIAPLNPFGYSHSGDSEFPKVLSAEIAEVGHLSLEAHIWPPNCQTTEYKLGGRAAARQGFYFYRNRRLIQAGGWNGLVQDDSEPHGSLARIKVDLPLEYDDHFGINVQKSKVLVPPGFDEVLNARAADGTSFEDFRRSAIETYRHAHIISRRFSPYPMKGIGARAARRLETLYGRGDPLAEGFSVRWKKLPKDSYFIVERDRGCLTLNSRYRECRGSGSGDIIKVLVALLVRNDFSSKKVTKAREAELLSLNEIFVSMSQE